MDYKPKHKFKLDLSEVEDASIESFVRIECPSCGCLVNSDGLELTKVIAKCSSCHAVFPFDKELGKLKSKIDKATIFQQPSDVEKFYFGDELDLSVLQTATFLEGMAAIFGPIFGLITFMAYYKGKMSFIIPAIILLITAYFIINLFNLKRHKTHVRVGSSEIYVEHRPKKGRKDVSFYSRDVDQLYVYKYTNMNGAQVYGVKIVVNDGSGQKHEKLLGNLKTIREAKFIEQEIEAYLKIKDEPMIEEATSV